MSKELDSLTHYLEQIKSFKIIMKINKVLRYIGLGSKKISRMEQELQSIEQQIREFQYLPKQFNKYLSSRGWIAYDDIDYELMKQIVTMCESESIEAAENVLVELYSPKYIDSHMIYFSHPLELSKRLRLIEFAFNDYKEEKYYSTIPLLLMVIDGTINNVTGKGFHANNFSMDVWDAITNIDSGIETIKSIFKKGRYKTNEEPIFLPYRNGILHGTDLNYDNKIVAAKCWHFLFVIRNWINSKKTEATRLEKFEMDTNQPPLRESLEKYKKIQEEKKQIDNWKPRNISTEYLQELNTNGTNDSQLPEFHVLKFIHFWVHKNYGEMARMYWKILFHNGKPNFSEVREQFKDRVLTSYEFYNIVDEAFSISEVFFTVEINKEIKKYKARLVYEGEDGQTHVRNSFNGEWKIVFFGDI